MTFDGDDGIIFICIGISAPERGKSILLGVGTEHSDRLRGGIQYETRFFV